MDAAPNNPPSNRLGPRFTEDDVAKAISKSGYPLQTIVASRLRPKFDYLQEEWSYVDGDTGQLRTMDMFARKRVDFNRSSNENPKVHTSLCLLIECKRSESPYVFFLSPGIVTIANFPLLCGLPNLRLKRSDGAIRYDASFGEALALDDFAFISEPHYCTSFSKLVRAGNKVELSGEDPFKKLVFPIAKAMQYHENQRYPKHPNYASYLCDITLGVAILDAPMVGVRVFEADNHLTYVPWVRVVRHESVVADAAATDNHTSKVLAIDIVHRDFFRTYLDGHVKGFAQSVAGRIEVNEDALASGTGTTSDNWTLRRNLDSGR
jgi:hypothetical protein